MGLTSVRERDERFFFFFFFFNRYNESRSTTAIGSPNHDELQRDACRYFLTKIENTKTRTERLLEMPGPHRTHRNGDQQLQKYRSNAVLTSEGSLFFKARIAPFKPFLYLCALAAWLVAPLLAPVLAPVLAP